MIAYIVKYALTDGIRKVEAEETGIGEMIKVRAKDDGNYNCDQLFHGNGNEWCKTLEEAKTKAEEMKNKKIKSLEKQLDKLKNMEIKIV